MVKRFQLLHNIVRFPSVVTRSPSNVKFDGAVNKAVTKNLVDKPLVVVGHPKVVKMLALTTGKHKVVIRLKRPKQRRMEFRVYPPGHQLGG
jgi:hypothetical protein